MTGRVCSESSRSGQALCWPSIAEVPLQVLKSATALVLCLCAGGSEQLAHVKWGGSPFLFRKAFSAPRKWGGITAVASVTAQSCVRPTAVNCGGGVSMSGVCRDWGHTPIWIGHGGCASTLESASPLLSSSEGSWIAGKLTKLALNPEESVPGAACPWGGRARGGQSTRMIVRCLPASPHL